MKIKVVGIENQDYKMDNGYEFKGRKLHCLDLETERQGLIGNKITNIKIADNSPLANEPLEVGKDYIVYFTQKGSLDFIRPSNVSK